MRKKYIVISNFNRYQHYKGDNMVWCKLYVKMLHDFGFMMLKDAEKWTFIALLLLACENKNLIPYDPQSLEKLLNVKDINDSIKALKSIHIIDLVYSENSKKTDKIREDKIREENKGKKPFSSFKTLEEKRKAFLNPERKHESRNP